VTAPIGGDGPGHTIGVAIAIPDPWGAELQEWRGRLGDALAHAIPTHITLLPPTTVDESVMPETEKHLAELAQTVAPFAIQLRGSGTFRPVSPVVFVTLATGIAECERLEQGVRTGPLERDLQFPYHPHVTVAHDLPDEALDRAFTDLADYRALFVVDRFHLYEHGDDGVWRSRQEFLLVDGGL
jgi:2'-5' RNA ligase